MNEKLKRLWATKNKNDEWWSSFVTAPIAILFNFFVVDWKWLTPNLLTLFSFLVACVSVALIVVGGQTAFYFAAALIHFSHVLDCMDGQMARYRMTTSRSGGFWDKMTDQIQVMLWFGAVGFAAESQTHSVLPIFLAFAGVAFYSLRGYIKYTTIYIEMCDDKNYLEKSTREAALIEEKTKDTAGLGHSV